MKKGFTLIEMISAVVILSIIALIVIPIVNRNISDSREKLYHRQVKTLEEAAQKWGTSYDIINTPCYISLDMLKEDGFLENGDVTNPQDETIMDGCISMTFDLSHNQNVYEYDECGATPTYCIKRGSN